jgi:pilus assembly protein CpaB
MVRKVLRIPGFFNESVEELRVDAVRCVRQGGVFQPQGLMATVGQTLFRFAGALLLGASATAMDHPQILEAPLATSRIATVPVVVAAKDIPEGAIVDRVALVVAQWPAGTQPSGAYTTLDEVTNRVARVGIYEGEAIVPGRLAPEGTGAGLEIHISPGKRAYGIRVDNVLSLPGLIQPNSRVDIAVVVDDGSGKRVAKLFMTNMRLLAVGVAPGQLVDGRPGTISVASIEVTPTEAEKLAVAASQGSLRLVPRGYGDPDSISIGQQAIPNASPCGPKTGLVRDLLFRKCATPAPIAVAPRPARPDSFKLKVYRGTSKREELKFEKDSAARAASILKPKALVPPNR